MNNMPILLDTCTLLWLMAGQEIHREMEKFISEKAASNQVYLNPFSAWEIAMLVAKKRLSLTMPVGIWFEKACKFPGMQLGNLSVQVLIHSNQLPGEPPKDPADRIMVALARLENMVLVTRDKPLLQYGSQGYVNMLKC